MTSHIPTATVHRFTSTDGVELSYCTWRFDEASDPTALVLVLHGIGYHAAPYVIVAEGLGLPGAVYSALDFRGHGGSGGPKGALPPTERMVSDIEEWVDQLKKEAPAVPIFMIGESMGGPYAALYASKNPGALTGLVLVAPAVLSSLRQVLHVDTLRAVGRLLRSPRSPSFGLLGSRLAAASKESSFVLARIEDPSAMQKVTAAYLMRIGIAIAELMLGKAGRIDSPTLIVQGERDTIVSPLGSRLLYKMLNVADKKLAIFPDGFHTLIWDSTAPEVFAFIEGWMSERLGRRQGG
ncbi:MAG: alpha/beta fold hydrolase [Chloroflexi bacterium]|nr:alpha/beta fold hydrolase [Chloroflexota bacterium]